MCALTWRPMPAAARFKLCSSVSAWLGVFTSIRHNQSEPEWNREWWQSMGILHSPPGLLEPHHQIVLCHIQDTCWGASYPSAEKQLVYSTVPTYRAMCVCVCVCVCVRACVWYLASVLDLYIPKTFIMLV